MAAHGSAGGNTVAAYLAAWNAAPDEATQINLEADAMQHGITTVKFEAVNQRDTRNQNRIQQLAAALNTANAAITIANANAAAAQAVATAATHNVFKPANPPRFENKDKDMDVRRWLAVVEDYARDCPADQYLRIASSFLAGKPRSYYQSKYDEHKAGHGDAEPPNPQQFFRETMINGYGLADQTQTYWDTWHNLRQLPNMDVNDYNIAFQQALTDLGDQIQGEQVKIEKYRLGLQSDLREMVRTSPQGTRWTELRPLIEYCTVMWPIVQARIAKRTKTPASSEKVGGKRKSSGGGSGGSGSKARLGATGKLSDEQRAHNMKEGLCHICMKPGHIAKDCSERDADKPYVENKNKKGKKGF